MMKIPISSASALISTFQARLHQTLVFWKLNSLPPLYTSILTRNLERESSLCSQPPDLPGQTFKSTLALAIRLLARGAVASSPRVPVEESESERACIRPLRASPARGVDTLALARPLEVFLALGVGVPGSERTGGEEGGKTKGFSDTPG